MTECDWLACAVPFKMIDFMKARHVSSRKWRLVACAGCRRVWHLLQDERSRRAVETAEAYADSLNNHETLFRARVEAREASRRYEVNTATERAATAARDATRDTGTSSAYNALAEAARAVCSPDHNICDAEEMRVQAQLLRCIVGNPFQPVSFDSAWRTPDVLAVAEAIYNWRDFGRLGEFAELVRAAGCQDSRILDHCLEVGRHARGCWVVDLALDKR